MLKNIVRNIGKGIKKYVEEKVNVCKEILSSAQNRMIVGLISVGLGFGLIASAYIKVE